jgi:hypothetical protein
VTGSVSFTGSPERLEAKLEGFPASALSRVGRAIAEEMVLLSDAALARMSDLFRNGGGKMREALKVANDQSDTSVSGTLSASGLPYLAIQEFGGVTSPHDIFPVNAAFLAFFGQASAQFLPGGDATGPLVFAKGVHHPGSVMPERSYLRYALATRRSAIRTAVLGAVVDAATEGNPT